MVTSLGIVPVMWMKLTFDCLLGFFGLESLSCYIPLETIKYWQNMCNVGGGEVTATLLITQWTCTHSVSLLTTSLALESNKERYYVLSVHTILLDDF